MDLETRLDRALAAGDRADKKNGDKRTLLHFALEESCRTIRKNEARCRRQLEAIENKTTPWAIAAQAMADIHAKAAAVYEDALAVLEGGAP